MNRLPGLLAIRYGSAAAAAVVAVALRLALNPVLGDQVPYATLFLAVLAVSATAGRGPALLTTALGALASSWLLPIGEGGPRLGGTVALAVYLIVGGGIAVLGGAMRAARLRTGAEADEAVRQREQAQLLLDSAGEALYGIDIEGRCTFCNPACVRMLGYADADDLLGRNMHDLIHHSQADGSPQPEDRCRIFQAFQSGEGIEADDEVFWRADGRSFPVHYRSHPIVHDGRAIGSIVSFTDIGERRRAEATIAEQIRLAEFGRDVGIALTRTGTLREVLGQCAEVIIRHLGGAFARIWTVDEAGEVLELQASAGLYTHLDGPHGRVPVGRYKIGMIARERKPHLTNAVIGDPLVPSQDWARQEGMVAFAGFPLVIENRLIGVLAMFARAELSGATLRAMESVADAISLGIDRKRSEEVLHREREWLRVTLSSIGDAVIATDLDGRITFLNGVAESLTGWRQAEARGLPLGQVFRIVNERTRREVESPAARALREGSIVGLANHTILIARDGSERAIDDSAAPIRGSDDSIVGAVLIFRDVAERRLGEQALEASEARKAAILDTALDAIITIDHEGVVVEWNPAAERIFGRPRAEAAGLEMADLIVPKQFREAHRRGLAHYMMTGEGPVLGRRIEISGLRADESEFPIELAITRINADGPPLFTAHVRDISDRLRADRALKEGEARFRDLADAVPQIVFVAEPDGTAEYFNRRWYDVTGLTPEAALAPDGWRAVIHPDDLPVIDDASRAAGAAGIFQAEYRIRMRDGSYRWHLGRSVPAVGDDGRVVRRYGTATDIDELRRAEQTARFLADASAALAGLRDYQETLVRVAGMAVPAFADWCAVDMAGDDGRPRRLAVEHPDSDRLRLAHELFERYPPRIDDPAGIGKVIRTGEPEFGEEISDELIEATAHDADHAAMLRALGLRSYICVPLRPRGGPAGALTFVTAESGRRYGSGDLLVAEDLARRATVAIENAELYRALQEADRAKDSLLASLLDSEERFRTMAESIPQLAWMARPDGHIYWYNKRWHDYAGTTPREMEGWGWQKVHDPAVLPSVMERWTASIANGEPFDMVFPLRGADGRFRPFLTRVMPVRDDSGAVVHWFGTNTDISDRLQFEEELRAAKEEAEAANQAKTQFLAVLSHELRTPLNPILLAASSMLERPADPVEIRPTLEMIRQNVNLQARLIDDLLDVMRIVRGKMPLHWEIADCHRLIDQAVQICRSEVFGHQIRLGLDLSADRRHVNADPARLQQVFWNLIKNAVKFTPEGGSVSIRTRNEGGPDPADERIIVEIADTGIGIAPEVLPRIFDPFQQGETTITRRFGGLGLGLAICKGVVDAHGGSIEAESAGPGRGTTFRVTLGALPEPASEAGDGSGSGSDLAAASLPSLLRILVVEDEPATLRLMARLLRGLGHEVTTAGSIAAAIESFDAGAFDLIVSDIGLPDGSGLELMRHAVASRGPTPAIALTGYGMEEDIRRSREAGFTAHLTKPIDFAKLEAMIRQVAPTGP